MNENRLPERQLECERERSKARRPRHRCKPRFLNAFTRILASTYRDAGVLVNAVDPGWVRTDAPCDWSGVFRRLTPEPSVAAPAPSLTAAEAISSTNSANERQRVSLASGAGWAPRASQQGAPGGEAPRMKLEACSFFAGGVDLACRDSTS